MLDERVYDCVCYQLTISSVLRRSFHSRVRQLDVPAGLTNSVDRDRPPPAPCSRDRRVQLPVELRKSEYGILLAPP